MDGVRRTWKLEFEVGSPETGVSGHGSLYHLQTERIVEQRLVLLERILRGDQEPDFLQSSVFTQVIGQCQVSYVNRVEGASEKSGPYLRLFFHWI